MKRLLFIGWLLLGVVPGLAQAPGPGPMVPNVAPIVGGVIPSGPAGGDLAGTYPNPSLSWISRSGAQTLNIGSGGTLGSNAFNSTAYLPLAGGTMSGNIAMGGNAITGGGTAAFTTVNGNTFTVGTYTLTGVAGKTLTFDKSLEFDGTDTTKMTFPSTSATIARTDAGQTFTGTNNFGYGGLVVTGSAANAYAVIQSTGGAGAYTSYIDTSNNFDVGVSGASGFFVYDGSNNLFTVAKTSGNAAIRGILSLPGLTGSTAMLDYLCWNSSGGIVTYDSSGTCLASSLRFKDGWKVLSNNREVISKIDVGSFTYKPEYKIAGIQESVSAESVAAADADLAVYDEDGLPTKPKLLGLIARLIGAMKEQIADDARIAAIVAQQQREIERLSAR